METWIKNYFGELKRIFDELPVTEIKKIIGRFIEAGHDGKRILVFGNGGSAANSSHFVNDLAKSASDATGIKFKCISLNENMSLITAIGNDYDYQDIFHRQLENLAEKGDLLMTLSVSGNSPNLVKAFEWARDKGMETVALIGAGKGRLGEIADHTIVIDSMHYGHVEDVQAILCHVINYALIDNPEHVKKQ